MPTKYKGYMGDMLVVDLSTREVSHYDVSDRDREMFLGGKGLAAKILFDTLPTGTDPLGPDAILIFNTGPLNGSGAPCTSRFNISGKSPLTGGIGSSNCGGNFGVQLKRAGYDGLIVKGKADSPVYIEITEDSVEIKDAAHLWGKNTEETQEALDTKAGIVCIGPAGENLVLYAAIISGERAAGRCGLGTVMGSKNLKAIQAKGKKKIPVHDPEGFKEAVKAWVDRLKAHPITGDIVPKYGTGNFLNKLNTVNGLPTANFSKGHYEDGEMISGEALAEKHLVKNMGCVSCPIRCGRVVNVDGKDVKGPEFETMGLFGSNILNNDLGAICDWNRQMDLLGLDTISAGGAIAFAMELTQRGLIESDLEFGKIDNIARTLDDIAYRRGLGDDLAEGVKRMADKYGGHDFAIHSKGLEIASYEPRVSAGMGLGYATANRGGCHLNAGYMVFFEHLGPITMDPLTPKSKYAWTIFQQNAMEAVSSSGNCLFTTYAIIPAAATKVDPSSTLASAISKTLVASGPAINMTNKMVPSIPLHVPDIPHSKVISKLTGMNMHLGNWLAAGERGYNMERLFNLSEGFTAADDTLPARFIKTAQNPDKPETKVPLAVMLPQYYNGRGWDKNGVPTASRLKRLGLGKYVTAKA